MTDNKYPMKLDEDYYACIANELLLARQSMSLWVTRLINLLVIQLVTEDTEFKVYSAKIKDLAAMIGINTGNIYEDVKKACIEAMQTVARIETKNPRQPWKIIHWLSRAEYDGNGTLTLSLSDDVKPYLIDLKRRGFYTQYQIKEILPMSSVYAIRLYQYIKCRDKLTRESLDTIQMSIEEARAYFECQDKFQRISSFKENVIERAVTQINGNDNSEYHIDVQYIKSGRTISTVIFALRPGKKIFRDAMLTM